MNCHHSGRGCRASAAQTGVPRTSDQIGWRFRSSTSTTYSPGANLNILWISTPLSAVLSRKTPPLRKIELGVGGFIHRSHRLAVGAVASRSNRSVRHRHDLRGDRAARMDRSASRCSQDSAADCTRTMSPPRRSIQTSIVPVVTSPICLRFPRQAPGSARLCRDVLMPSCPSAHHPTPAERRLLRARILGHRGCGDDRCARCA